MKDKYYWILLLIIAVLLATGGAIWQGWRVASIDLGECEEDLEASGENLEACEDILDEQGPPGPTVVVEPDESGDDIGWGLDPDGSMVPVTPTEGQVNEVVTRALHHWKANVKFKPFGGQTVHRTDATVHYLRFKLTKGTESKELEIWRIPDTGSPTGVRLLWTLDKVVLVPKAYDSTKKLELREDFFWAPSEISLRIIEGGALIEISPVNLDRLLDLRMLVAQR